MSLPIGTVTSMIQTQHTELKTLYTVDNTQQTTKTAMWECKLSHEQASGIIKSAMLDYEMRITNMLVFEALLTGDIGEAVRLSVISLANNQLHRMDMPPEIPYDNAGLATVEKPAPQEESIPQSVSEKRNERMVERDNIYTFDDETDL